MVKFHQIWSHWSCLSPSVIECASKFDLLLRRSDALIVQVDLLPNLDGEDLIAVGAVDVDKPAAAGLGRRADFERGEDGEIGGKFFREYFGRWKCGCTSAGDLHKVKSVRLARLVNTVEYVSSLKRFGLN